MLAWVTFILQLADYLYRHFWMKTHITLVELACCVGFTLVLLISTSSATAQGVYRCQLADGRISFSDSPCGSASKSERLEVVPNSLDHAGAREQQLLLENQRLRDQLRAQQQIQSIPSEATSRPERIDSFECRKARRDYEVTANSSSNSKKVIEAKRSAMYGICGMREPDRTDVHIKNEVNVHAPGFRR